MNTILLTLGTFLSSYPNPAPPDTIILNAGKNSKVIFYGQSPEDLKKLEMLDLNKILKELNGTQAGTEEAQKHVTLTNTSFISEPVNPSKSQHYLASTFLNLHVGAGYNINRYTFFQASPALMNHPTGTLTCDVVMQNLLTSSLSVVHDMKFADRPGYIVSLRYGAGIGLNIQRYLHWNLVAPVLFEDLKQVTDRAKEIMKENRITPLKSDFNALQTYIQVAPRFALKNKKGQSTFYLNAGARLNYNRNFENASPSLYSNAVIINNPSGPAVMDDAGPIVTGGGYGVFTKKHTLGLSYIAEIGYKWIGLFVLYYPNYVELKTSPLNGTDTKNPGFSPGKTGNLGFASFGIKLGR
ncbi:hypothetical protein [Dyadobacter sp. CY343]|uniref:hypothetical protein n=1 Tax=Dyadobacter sp. CY343 TaxID=2907299 RepID=UPI001F183C66|nr:hypothetical protein [Dyadobacter sp. CY343]MCE7060353.1 hypothetical protein [Dyadobacter sp. CY343]